MSDQHPGEDLLTDLALDDIAAPRRDEILRHLDACPRCRSEYDRIAGAVDHALAAAPRTEPPPGFDRAVVDAWRQAAGDRADRPGSNSSHRVVQFAAAVIVGIVLGATGVVVAASVTDLGGSSTPASEMLTANSALLRTDDGNVVGTVAVSMVDGRPVVVVAVSNPAVGVDYTCRLLLADGRRADAGIWRARSQDGWTWVVSSPEGDVVGVQLVNRAGAVWSSADLLSRR